MMQNDRRAHDGSSFEVDAGRPDVGIEPTFRIDAEIA